MKKYSFTILLIIIAVRLQAQPFSVDYSLKFNFDMRDWGCEVDDINELANGDIIVGGNFMDFSQGSTYSGFIRTDDYGNFDNSFYYYPNSGNTVYAITNYLNGYLVANYDYFERIDNDGHVSSYTNWNDTLANETYCEGNSVEIPLVLNGDIYFSTKPLYYFKDSVNHIYGYHTLFHVNSVPKLDVKFVNKYNLDGVALEIKKYDSTHYLLTGEFGNYFEDSIATPSVYICRVDTGFNIDTGFHSPLFPIVYGGVFHSYVQKDGKIIVAGSFLNSSGDTLDLVRLNLNGSIDSSFNTHKYRAYDGNFHYISCVCPTSDGGYLLGGNIQEYEGYAVNGIVKTDSNGHIDTHYFMGYGIDSICGTEINVGETIPWINNIKKGMNDKYYVFGVFNHYNGLPAQPVIRLNGLSTPVDEILSEKQRLNVYPNPASEQVRLNIPEGNTLHHYSVTLFDINSKPLYHFNTPLTESYIGLNQYASGIYIIKIENEQGEEWFAKLIKI